MFLPVRRGLLSSASAVFAVVAALLVLLLLESNGGSVASAAPPKVNACGATVSYDAYKAPARSQHFGPNQNSHDLSVMTNRMGSKNCSDLLFAATFVSFINNGGALDSNSTQQLASQYVTDHSRWTKDVQAAMSKIDKFQVEDRQEPFETLGMVPGASSSTMPQLIKIASGNAIGWSLVAHMKDGTERVFRIECDLQPSVSKFPKVPTTPPAPPKTVTPPPTHPTPVCKSNCGYTTPVCKVNCGSTPPPSQCHCITPAQARQPVPQPAQQSPGVPNTAPSPHPQGPGIGQAPPTESSPNGYNPSGGSAPGGGSSNGGSTTVNQPKPDPTPTQSVPTTDPNFGGTPPPPS